MFLKNNWLWIALWCAQWCNHQSLAMERMYQMRPARHAASDRFLKIKLPDCLKDERCNVRLTNHVFDSLGIPVPTNRMLAGRDASMPVYKALCEIDDHADELAALAGGGVDRQRAARKVAYDKTPLVLQNLLGKARSEEWLKAILAGSVR